MENFIPRDLALGQERVSIGFYSSKTQLEPLAPPEHPLAAPSPPSLERGRAVGTRISFPRFFPCNCSLSSSQENRHQRELQRAHIPCIPQIGAGLAGTEGTRGGCPSPPQPRLGNSTRSGDLGAAAPGG